jgi:hypothetical protein
MADSRPNGNRIDSFGDRKSVDHAFIRRSYQASSSGFNSTERLVSITKDQALPPAHDGMVKSTPVGLLHVGAVSVNPPDVHHVEKHFRQRPPTFTCCNHKQALRSIFPRAGILYRDEVITAGMQRLRITMRRAPKSSF